MRGHVCALAAAAGTYGLWVAVSYTWPFLVFAVREKQKGNHATLICRAHEECNVEPQNFTLTEEELQRHAVFSPDLSIEEADRIYGMWYTKFEDARMRGRGPLIIHVGPADLGDEDFAMYSRVAPFLHDGRVFLVEPHPGQQLRLRDRVGLIPNGSTMSMTILPAALCPSTDHDVAFYRIADHFFREFRDYAFYIRYWASLDKQHLIDETQFFNYNQKVWLFKALGIFPKSFPEAVEDWLHYIEAVHVRCHSPSSLLSEVGAKPDEVDVLILDAEGYDTELMDMFLAIDGFAPLTLMFEWHLHANNASKIESLLQVVRALHARGYDVHRHNHDVIAVAQGS